MKDFQDTIVAISTPSGSGAIGVIRLSGKQAISIVSQVFEGKNIENADGYSLHFGKIMKEEAVLDEVLLSVFRAPRSYTREDTVEISFHGSPYILSEGLELFVKKGARLAYAGEFTQRAYLNGAMDLSQAEAVADLIASSSQMAHHLAMKQMKGGISDELALLRQKLLDFTSLIELELDFGEEDVEFADRDQLLVLVNEMQERIKKLSDSFRFGNAVKSGVPTVILGRPNAGKSTLLNALLQENRAIVSDIPGTTRDVIEDRLNIDGIEFRIMDTAGLRETDDPIEKEGVQRSLSKAREEAELILYIFDINEQTLPEARHYLGQLSLKTRAPLLLVGNKIDTSVEHFPETEDVIWTSAKNNHNVAQLKTKMSHHFTSVLNTTMEDTIITNRRHLDALQHTLDSLNQVSTGLQHGLTGDLLSIDIRTALHHLGEITGEISNDEVLGNIFGKFCIGK